MVSLQPLETVGYAPTFFTLPTLEQEKAEFTYYTFDENIPRRQPSSWDIVGLRRRGENPSLLDWEQFEALRDADDYLRLKPSTLLALIQFLEQEAEKAASEDPMLSATHRFTHFHLMESEELLQLHLFPWQARYDTGSYYRYRPRWSRRLCHIT